MNHFSFQHADAWTLIQCRYVVNFCYVSLITSRTACCFWSWLSSWCSLAAVRSFKTLFIFFTENFCKKSQAHKMLTFWNFLIWSSSEFSTSYNLFCTETEHIDERYFLSSILNATHSKILFCFSDIIISAQMRWENTVSHSKLRRKKSKKKIETEVILSTILAIVC